MRHYNIFTFVLFLICGCTTVAEDDLHINEECLAEKHGEENIPMDVYTVGVLNVLPKFKQRERPKYPNVMRIERIEGLVRLAIVIENDGSVSRVDTLFATNCYFEQAAVDAMQSTSFYPAMIGDRPVKTYVTIPVSFRLH